MNQPSVETLRGLPLLEGMSDAELDSVAKAATIQEFAKGDVVLRQGTRTNVLWIVLEGKCDAFRVLPDGREEIVLAQLGQGGSFGEMSFFTDANHSATVRAASDSRLVKIGREQFDEMVQHGCAGALKLTLNTVQTLAARLQRMDDWVSDLVTSTPRQKDEPEWARFRKQLFGEWDSV